MTPVVRSTADWEAQLGQWIRATRKQRKLSQQELADKSNVSRSAIKYIEAGNGSSLATFLNVMRALGLEGELEKILTSVSSISPLAILEATRKANG